MFLFRGAASAAGNLPYEQRRVRLDRRSATSARRAQSHGALEILEHVGLLLHIGVMLVFLIIVLQLQAPAHLHRADQHHVQAAGPVALGAVKPMMSDGKPVNLEDVEDLDEDTTLGVGSDRGLQLEGPARLGQLHRVRPLPVPVPGLEHREAALSEDADHEPARPRVREGAVPPGRTRTSASRPVAGSVLAEAERPLVGETEGEAWHPTVARSSTPTCCGPARTAAPASTSARSTSSTSTTSSTCAATRCWSSPTSRPS